VARELGVPRQMMAAWLKRAAKLSPSLQTEPLTSDEREELKRLRRDNERLRMEREILKKAAAFFAKESE
jgi:transposase